MNAKVFVATTGSGVSRAECSSDGNWSAFREGLRAFFMTIPDIEFVGEAASGAEAVAQAEALQPNVVLMDINMPGINGTGATRRILHTSPNIIVVVVTILEDDASVPQILRIPYKNQ